MSCSVPLLESRNTSGFLSLNFAYSLDLLVLMWTSLGLLYTFIPSCPCRGNCPALYPLSLGRLTSWLVSLGFFYQSHGSLSYPFVLLHCEDSHFLWVSCCKMDCPACQPHSYHWTFLSWIPRVGSLRLVTQHVDCWSSLVYIFFCPRFPLGFLLITLHWWCVSSLSGSHSTFFDGL